VHVHRETVGHLHVQSQELRHASLVTRHRFSGCRRYRHDIFILYKLGSSRSLDVNLLMGPLKPQSSNTVISTLGVDGWAVGTARRGLGELRLRPVSSSLYQQPTHQRPVYGTNFILFAVTL